MNKILLFFSVLSLIACTQTPTKTSSKINDDKVYFAFDSAELSQDAVQTLKQQSLYLKKNPDANVVLSGHCDERGSVDYNLALGALRAENTAQTMIKMGIEPERIKAISYGKNKPQFFGTGEEVWAKNRNVTTTVK